MTRRKDLHPNPSLGPANYGIVLLSHNSPDPRQRLASDLLARRVGHRLSASVSLASLDQDRARLDGAIAHFKSKGIHDIVVVPLILSVLPEGTDQRLPDPRSKVMVDHPEVQLTVSGPVGCDPHLLKGLDQLLRASGHRPNDRMGVVLGSAGSISEEVRAAHAALAEKWETQGWGAATHAFASGQGQTVAEAVDKVRASGVERVIMVPFVMSPGQLAQRLGDQAREAGAEAIQTGLHSTDAAVDVVAARVLSARARVESAATARQ